MIDIAILRAAGLSDEQILKVLELDQNERKAVRREQNRINKQNQRSRQHFYADIEINKQNQRSCQHVSADTLTSPLIDKENPACNALHSVTSSSPPSSPSLPSPTPPSITTPPFSPPPDTKKARAANATLLPEGYNLSERMINYALDRKWTPARVQDEFEKFVLHAQKKGCRYVNWDAAWQSWVRSPYQLNGGGNGGHHAPAKKSLVDVCNDLLEEIDDRERAAKAGNRTGPPALRLLP
jgi:hypothetical protein